MMLMREEHALMGESKGYLAISPAARAGFPLLIAFVTSRKEDPLIRAFIEATQEAWPEMKPVKAHEGRRGPDRA